MDEYKLYGLNAADEVLSVENIRADDSRSAMAIATSRLSRFPRVELWLGTVCILRKSRDPN